LGSGPPRKRAVCATSSTTRFGGTQVGSLVCAAIALIAAVVVAVPLPAWERRSPALIPESSEPKWRSPEKDC
jgi:hypothetical protein